ncbi:MAG: hypothetical protein HDS67_02190 [Bacteroidales bacterium]|nr:hypothetical protein [Bacteroidales bacterium]
MQIRINGAQAVLKKGSSFDYVSENRMFSDSDAYTLSITFPLRGCPENLAIFGHVNRADVLADKLRFDCEIADINFVKSGVLTITGISESEVQGQFLEGRSEQNFDKTFDTIFINDLPLGEPEATRTASITPEKAWNPQTSDGRFVALPWVNDYSGNIQNLAEYVVDDASQHKGHYVWNEKKCTGLSWQPYLLWLTRQICDAVGYTVNLSPWEQSEEHRWLLVCNTLPAAWAMPEFANALPRWTVEEYFRKLELFMGGEFEFDHRAKHIDFRFTADILEDKKPVCLENVTEEHSSDVADDETECKYREVTNLVYKDCDNATWKWYSCDWFISAWKDSDRVVCYDTLAELIAANKGFRMWNGEHLRGGRIEKLFYAADCDAYFAVEPYDRILRGVDDLFDRILWYFPSRLRPVNLFGGRIVNESDDAPKEEIEFVPARIDETEKKYGRILFLSLSANDDDDVKEDDDEEKFLNYQKPFSVLTLEAGEKEKKTEFFDRIFVGWYDGSRFFNKEPLLPAPAVENIMISDDWENFGFAHFSLRLNDRNSARSRIINKIEPKMKTTFRWLSSSVPDVRSVFVIRGKRYVCEKITASFSESGRSALLKGDFYPIIEDQESC